MRSGKRTILLVEDDTMVAIATKHALGRMEYDVLTAASGEEAIAMTGGGTAVDLILMDIDLGKGMDGTEAACRILESLDVPIVFLSSHNEREIVEKTELVTSYGYVVKNSDLTVLDASIKMAFKLFEANQRLVQSHELLENVINTFPGFVIWKDTDSRFMGCNENFARKSGFSASSDLVGKSDADLPFKQEEVARFIEDDRSVMNSRTPMLHIKEREHLANGEEILLDTCKFPLFDSKEKVVGLLAIAMDITELERKEGTLREGKGNHFTQS